MPKADTRMGAGHSMTDWLALHGVTAAQMQGLLLASAKPASRTAPAPKPDPFASTGIAPEMAWDWAAQAALARWPGLAPRIKAAHACQRRFDLDPAICKRPFTYHPETGPDGGLLVGMAWRGRLRDLLDLAHEFGHALQLTHGHTLPPILREACAFMAEAALVAHLPCLGSEQAAQIATDATALWHHDSARLAGPKAQALRHALQTPDAAYEYGWNYPPARILAARILAPRVLAARSLARRGSADPGSNATALFAGDLPLSAFLAD